MKVACTVWAGAKLLSSSDLSAYFDGDECYGLFILTEDLADALSAMHPSQLLFSTQEPGVQSRIKLIDQIWTALDNYLNADPDIEYYEVVS